MLRPPPWPPELREDPRAWKPGSVDYDLPSMLGVDPTRVDGGTGDGGQDGVTPAYVRADAPIRLEQVWMAR